MIFLFFFFKFPPLFVSGVRQAAWLTKSKVIPGLPPALLSLAEIPENQLPDQDERVKNAIRHARFWDTTDPRPRKNIYSNTLLHNLLHLCATQRSTHPAIGRRIFAEKYSLATIWKRGDDLLQIRGQNGLLQCSMDPLPEVCGKQEVADTSDHILETFYPVSPTIDLQQVNVYKEMSCTGFTGDYQYPHAHTLYFLESTERQFRLSPEQFRAKMVMFTFGNALARAHKLYGFSPLSVLDRPITVQAVGTNGRIFQFLVFQLNTTDLSGDNGIKNQVWLDESVELYDFAKVRPLIRKKQVKEEDFEDMIDLAEIMENLYGSLFDKVIVNGDVTTIFRMLKADLEKMDEANIHPTNSTSTAPYDPTSPEDSNPPSLINPDGTFLDPTHPDGPVNAPQESMQARPQRVPEAYTWVYSDEGRPIYEPITPVESPMSVEATSSQPVTSTAPPSSEDAHHSGDPTSQVGNSREVNSGELTIVDYWDAADEEAQSLGPSDTEDPAPYHEDLVNLDYEEDVLKVDTADEDRDSLGV
ncbi:39S ribosomal protein L37, mitochondrial [Nematolebias whitei]|uniref:39S ribosomal protein L37, mitochondrial n=1 Tax=Nematolebias whitei TaxID=451745 RepID=UPI001897ED73|nr:39S ribosomal protein L37, mitochondrial [Nematolebias whitei]